MVHRSIGAKCPALLEEIHTCNNPAARAAATRLLHYWHSEFDYKGIAHLNRSAKDEDGIVRLEAVIAATYYGTAEALEAVTPVFEKPMSDHLKFAAQCALISKELVPHWQANEEFLTKHPAIKTFSEGWNKHAKLSESAGKRSKEDIPFDMQKGIKVVEISCVPERMLYTKTKFKVKAGQPVKLIFTNPDATQHNLVIVRPGTAEEVGIAGNEMAKDPGGITKGFIPESEDILQHTKLLNPDTAEVLRFIAPKEAGVYPYLCTFPGHWIVMKGQMVVELWGSN